MSKKPVTISVSSVQEDGDLRESTVRAHTGALYDKDDALWILYEDAGTTTTLRLAEATLRIHRRGLVNGWQEFEANELTGGLLSLGEGAGGEMILRILTQRLDVTRDPHRGRIQLAYELFTGTSASPEADPTEVSLGRFSLDMVWDTLEP